MDTRYCLHPVILQDKIVPCGVCPVCRMKYRKMMAVRLYIEKSIEQPIHSFFITLTYNDYNIPTIAERSCFSKEHLQRFLSSVRKRLYRQGFSLRYFATCEYGEEGYRPHYHLILLLYRTDRRLSGKGGRSPFHERHSFLHTVVEPLWNKGFCYDGTVSLASIMYCTAYALKDDESLERDWTGFDEGKPFRLFSRKPGLGLTDKCVSWWTDYVFNDCEFRSGVQLHLPKRGVSAGVPTGIKRKFKDDYPDIYEAFKASNLRQLFESSAQLNENARKYGAHAIYCKSSSEFDSLYDHFDPSPDEEITVFRKAVRELSKRQRNPLK